MFQKEIGQLSLIKHMSRIAQARRTSSKVEPLEIAEDEVIPIEIMNDTIKTTVPDIVRNYPWPEGFSARVLRNSLIERWHGHEAELATAGTITADFRQG